MSVRRETATVTGVMPSANLCAFIVSVSDDDCGAQPRGEVIGVQTLATLPGGMSVRPILR
jgi:hypothetical protein